MSSNLQNEKDEKKEVKEVPVSGTWRDTDTVYMSNNINRWTVMPLSPNQINGQNIGSTINVNIIRPFTAGQTIQVQGNMNTGGSTANPNSYTFQYRGQSIYPYEIYDAGNGVIASASVVGNNVPTFTVAFPGTDSGTTTFVDSNVTFNTDNTSNYSVNIYGDVGIGTTPNGYALNVLGDANVSGALNIGSVTVSTLGVGTTTVAPDYVFDVSGDSLFEGNVNSTSNINATYLLSGNRLRTTLDADIGTSLLVGTTSELTGNVGIGKAPSNIYSLDVLGSANISDTLITNQLETNQLQVDLSGNIATDLRIGRNVGIGKDPISVNSEPDSLSVAGNIEVFNSTYVRDKLVVAPTGSSTIATTTLFVVGDSTLKGDSTLNGNISIQKPFGGNGSNVAIGTLADPYTLDLYDTLNVLGTNTSVFNGNVTINGTLTSSGGSQGSSDISGNLAVSGTLDVSGATTFRSTLNVTGNTTFRANLDVSGTSTLRSTLDVSGASTLRSTLTVSGASTLRSTLDVSGASILRSTLDVSGASTLRSTLDVSGASTLRSTLDVSGASTLRSTLTVSGATILRSTLDVSGDLDVSGAANIAGNLNYHVYQERIQWQNVNTNNGRPVASPGYWSFLTATSTVTLYMPTNPAVYIIDGSGGGTEYDMSVNIVSPVGYTQPTGMTFYFVGRNASTSHTISYPCTGAATPNSSTLTPPLNMSLICIGANDYSSSV